MKTIQTTQCLNGLHIIITEDPSSSLVKHEGPLIYLFFLFCMLISDFAAKLLKCIAKVNLAHEVSSVDMLADSCSGALG